MYVGRRQRHRPNERVGLIHRDMDLVAIMWLASFDRVARVAIAAAGIGLDRRPAGDPPSPDTSPAGPVRSVASPEPCREFVKKHWWAPKA